MSSKNSNEFALSSILKALGLTSSATLVAILISAMTNKILSVIAGPEGIGLMGVFRNLGSLFGGILTLGYTTILAQQVSKAKTEPEKALITQAALLLFVFQAAVAVIILLFFSPSIEGLFFQNSLGSGSPGNTHTLQIRIVLLMALVNIFLQIITAILRGQSEIKQLSFLQIFTALGSLAMIYPLTQMGETGLAINVGSGSIIGGLMGVYYLCQRNHFSLSVTNTRAAFSKLKNSWGASLLVTVQTFTSIGGLLIVQTLIQRRLGLKALGNYNAAMLVLDTLVLVLMSAVRSYLLPMLSRCRTEHEREVFFSRFLTVMLGLATTGAGIIWLLAPFFIRLLFSPKFHEAEGLLKIFGLSLVTLTLVWMYNTLLLHFEKHLAFTLIDSCCIFIYIMLVNSIPSSSLSSVAWCYLVTSCIAGGTYVFYAYLHYGKGFLPLNYPLFRRVPA